MDWHAIKNQFDFFQILSWKVISFINLSLNFFCLNKCLQAEKDLFLNPMLAYW